MTTPDHVMSAPWWWQAVSEPVGKTWGRIEARQADGSVVASMPYQLTRRGPFAAMLMPALTQTGHLWTDPGADRCEALTLLLSELRAMTRRHRILMVQVADYLSEADKQILAAHGFNLQDRVSYQIKPGAAADISSLLHSDKRRKLNKASGHFTLDEQMTPDELYDAIGRAYGRVRYPRQLFTRLATAAIANGNGVILRAKAESGDTAAAVMLAFDTEAAYYLTPAIDHAHMRDGANEWLTVQAIAYAHSRGLTFDFEGSMAPAIARSYRHFGGTPAHYTFATLYRPAAVKWLASALTTLKKK